MVTLWTMSGLHYNRWLLASDGPTVGEIVHQPRTLTINYFIVVDNRNLELEAQCDKNELR